MPTVPNPENKLITICETPVPVFMDSKSGLNDIRFIVKL